MITRTIEAKEQLINKFQELSGLDLNKLPEYKSKANTITFDAFNVDNSSINASLLAMQGINSEYIKLQSLKKGNATMQEIWLFRTAIHNNTEKLLSFYRAYVEKTSDTPIKTNTSTVAPLEADNSNKGRKKRTSLLTLAIGDTPEIKKPAVIESVAKKEPDKLDQVLQAIAFLTSEITTVKSELDTVKATKAGKKLFSK